MPLPLLAIGAGTLFGAAQTFAASRMERNNPFQARTVNSLIANNAAQAQNQAQIGIAQQQYNNARNQQAQNLATVLGTASRTGRNIPLAGLLRQGNLSTQQLNATDAQARQQNQRYAAQQNQVLAQEQQNVRSYNIEQPYLRRQQQAAETRSSGISNIFGGIGAATSIGLMTGGNAAPQPTEQLQQQPYVPNFFGNMQRYGNRNYGLGGFNS